MKLTDLIEYTPEQKEIISQFEHLGLDVERISNPNLTISTMRYIGRLLKYNIDVKDEHYEKMNIYGLECYVSNGYLRNDIILTEEFLDNLSEEYMERLDTPTTALLDSLGVDITDVHTLDDVAEKLSIHFGREYKNETPHEMEEYFEPSDLIYSTHLRREHYYHEKGTQGLRTDGDLNLLLVLLHQRCPEEKIQRIIELIEDNIDKPELVTNVEYEYRQTGRCDILIDQNYKMDERRKILEYYITTGVDARLIPNTMEIINRTKSLTIEEMIHYRKRSNEFRRTNAKELELI